MSESEIACKIWNRQEPPHLAQLASDKWGSSSLNAKLFSYDFDTAATSREMSLDRGHLCDSCLNVGINTHKSCRVPAPLSSGINYKHDPRRVTEMPAKNGRFLELIRRWYWLLWQMACREDMRLRSPGTERVPSSTSALRPVRHSVFSELQNYHVLFPF